GKRARALRRWRRLSAQRIHAKSRRTPAASVRRRHPGSLSRQGTGVAVLEQPDLPLAESRRVQSGVQRADELERQLNVVFNSIAERSEFEPEQSFVRDSSMARRTASSGTSPVTSKCRCIAV